jgi:hypothetical protein
MYLQFSAFQNNILKNLLNKTAFKIRADILWAAGIAQLVYGLGYWLDDWEILFR